MMIAAGLFAGTLGGLLGIGGGVVLMPTLRFAVGLPAPYAIGTCVIAVFFTTLGGAYAHHRMGHVPVRFLLPVVISGALSTMLCSLAFLCLTTRSHWLDIGVGVVFSLVSVHMIIDGARHLRAKEGNVPSADGVEGTNKTRKIALGTLSGVLPGIFGIGAGAILVPGFIYLLRTPTQVAIGSALACFAVNALLSTVFKLAQGYVELSVALPICAGTLVGSQLGATLSRRFSSAVFKMFFGVVFLSVSFRFFLAAGEVIK